MKILNIQMEEGITILIIGLGIVFLSLIIMHQVFQFIVPFFVSGCRLKKTKVNLLQTQAKARECKTGEEVTAVAAAIYMFMEESHDEENAIITISKSSKSYSPWSSKIYTTHNLVNR